MESVAYHGAPETSLAILETLEEPISSRRNFFFLGRKGKRKHTPHPQSLWKSFPSSNDLSYRLPSLLSSSTQRLDCQPNWLEHEKWRHELNLIIATPKNCFLFNNWSLYTSFRNVSFIQGTKLKTTFDVSRMDSSR